MIEVSRLNIDQNLINADNPSQIEIYCTIAVDTTPWVCLTRYNGVPYMILDLIISKVDSQNLGVVFKHEYIPDMCQNCIVVETIVAGGPAATAEMKKGDVIFAVNGKKITNMNQVAKFVRHSSQRRFVIRVERKYHSNDTAEKTDKINNTIKKSTNKSDSSSISDLQDDNSFNSIKFSDLRDFDGDTASDSGNTSSAGGNNNSRLFRRRKSSIHVHSDDSFNSLSGTSSNGQLSSVIGISSNVSDLLYVTKEKTCSSLITFEDKRTFQIDSEQQYLNIGVWAKVKQENGQTKLLGYINAPIKLVLRQCCASSAGHYLKCYALLPPDSGEKIV